MSKTRNRSHHSELDYLRTENKQLKAENRDLKKQLRGLEKKSHWFERQPDLVNDVEEDAPLTCPECGKGQLIFIDFVHIKIISCNLCDYKVKEFKDGRKETVTTKAPHHTPVKTGKQILDRQKRSKRKVKTSCS